MKDIFIKPDTVLIRPRITEKAALSAAKANVYAFDVKTTATKRAIAASIKEVYGVKPEMVHMLAIPKKRVWRRGKWGVTGGGKKAYVFLKKGDKIEAQ
jgi:ribosomal protein L23